MEQSEHFGNDSLKNISEIISIHNAKKILLVTGKKSFEISGSEEKLSQFLKNVDLERFFDFEVNPNIEDVKTGVNIINSFKPDLIIAIGGGSVIDIAKLINIFAVHVHKQKDIYDFVNKSSSVSKRGLPLIAIPTTSGTGSEATHFAVVYIGTKKYSFAHEYVLPNYAIIDPTLSYSSPSYIKACSALDALSQSIESFWAVGSSEESRSYSRRAIKLILSSIELAVNKNDLKAMNNMAIAANFAGKAINISKTTAAHALSYPITKYLNIPHGHAVALTLGKFFVINSKFSLNDLNDKRGIEYFEKIIEEINGFFECSDSEMTCTKWYQLMENLSLENDLKSIFRDANIEFGSIVNDINLERLNNNPVKIGLNQIEKLFL
jgi:alcohol dehydrogenase class IV